MRGRRRRRNCCIPMAPAVGPGVCAMYGAIRVGASGLCAVLRYTREGVVGEGGTVA